MSDRVYTWGSRQCEYWEGAEEAPGCFVYVLQAEGDEPVKVGKAVDIFQRLPEIQLGNPRKLTVRNLIPGSERLERRFHRHLRPDRLSGEWFAGLKTQAFLRWMDEFSEQLILAHLITGRVVEPEEFIGQDRREPRRKREPAPVTVRYVVPEPLSPEEVKGRMREIEERRV